MLNTPEPQIKLPVSDQRGIVFGSNLNNTGSYICYALYGFMNSDTHL